MDEMRYQSILKNEPYQALLREAAQARLVARIRRAESNVYPAWITYLLVRLSAALIAAGTRLQARLNTPASLPQIPCEQQRQYSYGD